MVREMILIGLGFLVAALITAQGSAVERLKVGTATKEFPGHYMPMLAGEEAGLWKEQGLEVEWVPFRTPPDLMRAVAGGTINIGLAGTTVVMPARAAGVPVVIVANLYPYLDLYMWVRSDSPIKELKDLKGAKIGIMRMGSMPHAQARAMTKGAGVEREVKFVGSGTIPETVAALRAGAIDALLLSPFHMIKLKMAGEVREIGFVGDYLPKDWMDQVVFARKDFIAANPDLVRRVVRAIIKGNNYALDNPEWTMRKMKETHGYTDEIARMMVKKFGGSRTGKIEPKAVENVRSFLIEYGLVPKDRIPPAEELYTREFTE